MPKLGPTKLTEVRRLAADFAAARPGFALRKLKDYGASAAVFALDTPDGERALKVYDPEFLSGEAGPAEVGRLELQRTLITHTCPTLVRLFDIVSERGTSFVLMEFLDWPQLAARLSEIPRSSIQPMIKQVVAAARFLEERGLVHRDIKPENILVSPDFEKLKLVDLGVLRDLSENEDRPDGTDHGHRRPFVATAQYSSPEYLFRLTPPSAELWTGLSIYQVGALLHDLITRRPLFDDEVRTGNRYAIARAVLAKIPDVDTDPEVPLELRALAKHCLTKDLKHRLDLVRWEDFAFAESDLVKQNARRLERLKSRAEYRARASHNMERLIGLRRDALEQLLTETRQLLQTNLPDLKIAVDNGDGKTGSLRLHIPSLTLCIDLCVIADWLDDESADSTLYVSACLHQSVRSPVYDGSRTTVTSLNAEKVNLQGAAFAVFEICQRALDEALTIIEGHEIIGEDFHSPLLRHKGEG